MNFLIIEDDLDVAEVVSLVIESRWPDATISHSSDGEFGVQLIRTQEPDTVILDIGLPGIDGFQVCSGIRAFSYTPIVMLTVRERPEDIAKGLDLGADDYIVKPFKPAELIARVNAVLSRSQKTHLKDAEIIFRNSDLSIHFRHNKASANGEPIRLAPTEYQIFYRLIQDAGKIVASQTLIDQIWGREYRSSPIYLAASISRLKGALQDHPNFQALILQEEPEGYSLALTGECVSYG